MSHGWNDVKSKCGLAINSNRVSSSKSLPYWNDGVTNYKEKETTPLILIANFHFLNVLQVTKYYNAVNTGKRGLWY